MFSILVFINTKLDSIARSKEYIPIYISMDYVISKPQLSAVFYREYKLY